MMDVKHNPNSAAPQPTVQERLSQLKQQTSPKLSHGLKVRTVKQVTTPRWVWLLLGSLGLVLIIFLALFLWSQHQISSLKANLDSKNNSAQIAKENQDLISKVGALIILPDDETPTIATVSDLDKLKGQPFFAKAELGDKVLIYAKAGKAILFRPSTNKIVELAPLTDSGAPSSNVNSNSNQ